MLQEPEDLSGARLLLASASPRRRALLAEAGLPVVLVEPGSEGPGRDDVAAGEHALRQARAKAAHARIDGLTGLLVAVDTVVAASGLCLGKPRDRDAARRQLMVLFGRDHEVFSAHVFVPVAAGRRDDAARDERVERAVVHMDRLEPVAIEAYLDTGDWRDKAGSYGLQSVAGDFTRVVEGRRDTVIGLTVSVVAEVWRRHVANG